MTNEIYTGEYLSRLEKANNSLGILNNLYIEKNKNLIFIYCQPKVGSTTLVSSIRLCATYKYSVIHLHNEIMLKVLYKITDVTILDIIKYNKFLGKNVFVFDIYRSPIEHKFSTFFENINTYHFNCSVEILKTYDIQRLINRFNKIFPYLYNNDKYKQKYKITIPENFDFNKKYIFQDIDGIKYIKLRLNDVNEWKNILKQILGVDIHIINDYETDNKPLGEIYKVFKKEYSIPENLFKLIEDDEGLSFYYSKQERIAYLNSWRKKTTSDVISYNCLEYNMYKTLSLENTYMPKIQMDHYIDNGCICLGCIQKRISLFRQLQKGEKINERIDHNKSVTEYLTKKAKMSKIIVQDYSIKKKQNIFTKRPMY